MTRSLMRVFIIGLILAITMAACGGGEVSPADPDAADPNGETPDDATAEPDDAEELEQSVLVLGLEVPSYTGMQWYIADEEGYFEDEGLSVRVVTFGSGSELLRAVVAGQVDIGASAAIATPATAREAGQDVVVFYGMWNALIYEVWAGPHISEPSDLVGGTIGVGGIGAAVHQFIEFWLGVVDGVDLNDVEILSIGGQGARRAAVEAGQVDATLLTPPEAFIADDNGLVFLDSIANHIESAPFMMAYAHRPFLEQNPNTVRAVLRAQNRATETLQTDLDVVLRVASEHAGIEDVDAITRMFEGYGDGFTRTGELDKSGVEILIQMLVDNETIAEPIPVDEIVYEKFIDEFN